MKNQVRVTSFCALSLCPEHTVYKGDLFTVLNMRNSFTELGAVSPRCPRWCMVLDILPDGEAMVVLS